MIKRFVFLSLFSICSSIFGAASASLPADLSPIDVVERAEEMMALHPTYKTMNTELAARLLVTFCDELDPCKTYLLREEVASWMDPTPTFVEKVASDFRAAKLDVFDSMMKCMGRAIERRALLEKRLEKDTLPKKVQVKVHEFEWAENEEDLYQRVRAMRGAQYEAVELLDGTLRQNAVQRLQKRRMLFEQYRTPQESSLFRQTLATFVMKAFACAMDSQSAFFTPSEAKQLLISMQQRLFGIGVLLRDDIDGFSVIKLVEGGPASRQKALEIGDKIIAINDEPIIGFDLTDVVELVRGSPGTTVRLRLIRKGTEENDSRSKIIEVKVKRGEVIARDLRFNSAIDVSDVGAIAHLRLHSFYQDDETSSYEDLSVAIEKAKKQYQLKGIVLDLRCNPGGLLGQAVAVTGLFVDRGVVVSVLDGEKGYSHLRNITTKKMWDGPLVVLINRASASASEIVAQALQDWGRAIVVGDDRSFGKGSFQIFTLHPDGDTPPNPHGEYKVTRGRYYTVSGRTPQLVGVQSDIVIPGSLCYSSIGEMYSKFPLSSDCIIPHFEDTFEDVPVFQRPLLQRLYSFGHQVRISCWTEWLSDLRHRSEKRVSENGEYQKFLSKARAEEEGYDEESENIVHSDFQLLEAEAILRDLIELSSRNERRAAA